MNGNWPALLSALGCYGDPRLRPLNEPPAVIEKDGMCHERSGGDPAPLAGDLLQGGENGLLAFLAIGAALLLWPRLRAAMLEPSLGQAEIQHPDAEPGKSGQPAVGPGEKVGEKLRQLAALRDDGIISAEEFETKKAELLRTF
jgi:hypothetical protein